MEKDIKFSDLKLSETVLKKIEKLGFDTPTKIQKEVIPLIVDGYDLVGQAQTGTGKTLAYASAIVSMITPSKKTVAIILVPTRELALQVCKEIETLTTKVSVLSVYGGSSIDTQIRTLRRGVDIVVGTPGRVMDLMKRKVLFLDNLEFFILDEADEMLNMGFADDIEHIFKQTNDKKQVLLLSATMPKAILNLAKKYMKLDYQSVSIEEISKTSINVTQEYYVVHDKVRTEALCRIIDFKNPELCLVFCRTRKDVDTLLGELSKRNYSAEAMHGDISQNARIKTLERFKNGYFNILIATDVAARGIHVNNIDMVINYNLPQDVEGYVHRIGRTGRANKKGEAITLIRNSERKAIAEISRFAKCEMVEKQLPVKEDIVKNKYLEIMALAEECIQENELVNEIELVRDLNKGDLIKLSAALIKLNLKSDMGSDFSKDVSVKERTRQSSEDTTRLFLTIGKMDNLKAGTLIDFLKKETGIDKDHFKNIDILTKFTFLDVTNEFVKEFMAKVKNKKLNGRVIRVEKANRK